MVVILGRMRAVGARGGEPARRISGRARHVFRPFGLTIDSGEACDTGLATALLGCDALQLFGVADIEMQTIA